MKRVLALFYYMAVAGCAHSIDNQLHSYAYISPTAAQILKEMRVSENVLIQFVDAGLKSRSIVSIDPNRVYDGSEDALRIDIRKPSNFLIVTLSVHQGTSIHNMLQRWRGRESLHINSSLVPVKFRNLLQNCMGRQLDELKLEINKDKYQRGEMLERQN